jgi:hypothetical protein
MEGNVSVRLQTRFGALWFPRISVLLGICLSLALTTNCGEPNSGNTVPRGGRNEDTRSAKPSSGAVGARTTQSLEYIAAGKLPQKLRHIALNATVTQVLALHPDFEGPNGTKPETRSGPGEATLFSPIRPPRDEVSLRVDVLNGRVLAINASVADLAPADAAEYQRTALINLGKPDVEVESSFRRLLWVWIDGDVRIQFQRLSGPCESSPQIVTLEIEVWPIVRRLLEAPPTPPINMTAREQQRLVASESREMGDPSAPPPVRKPLPSGLRGLQLRMKPWQARQAAPGLNLESVEGDPLMLGDVHYADGTGCVLQFWREELQQIQCWQGGSAEELLAENKVAALENEFGTATDYVHGNLIGWQNQGVSFAIGPDYNHKGNVMYSVSDDTLRQESDCAKKKSRNYRETPRVRSFF